jgi:hypothetical protein
MVRKGQMHVMDAIAAILVLMFFAAGNFNPSVSNDWTGYENQIAATDLSYALERSGYVERFVQRGETGSLKAAVDGISERDLDVSGEITGIAPNLKVGYYTLPSDINYASISRVNSSDPCSDAVQDQLQPLSQIDIMRTDSGGMQGTNDGITVYIGNYKDGEAFGSDFDFDTIWVDRDDNCDFPNANDPVRIDDTFKWGNSPDRYYQFRNAEVDGDTWKGTLKLVDATQIRRLQNTMNRPVDGIENKVKVNSFNFSSGELNEENLEEADFLFFPSRESIERIEQTGREQRVVDLSEQKPILFAADLNSSIVEDGVIEELGFRWKDLRFNASQPEANCDLADLHTINECGDLEIGFTNSPDSKKIKEDILGQETDFDDISLYPSGSLVVDGKGALSSDKTIYLENYAYSRISQDRINQGMTEATPGGRPSTYCNNVTSAVFEFPNRDGDLNDNITVVNTQLGNTDSYCSQNNRALYIDRDEDGDFDEPDEGPLQDGEKTEIRGLSYTVDIIPDTAPGCGPDECAGFLLEENAQLDLLPYNSQKNVGIAGYEASYSESDRKVLAAFMYMMAGPTQIPSDSKGEVSTNLYGSTKHESYKLNLRWTN